MQKAWVPLCLLLMLSWVARADGAPEQATAAHVPAKGHLKKQVHARGAEVARLERQVSQQESRSREADQRLQAQNRKIAQLQQQLEELTRAQSRAGSGG